MSEQFILTINPHCHQGKGWNRWQSIKGEVMRRLPDSTTSILLEQGTSLNAVLTPLLQGPDTCYLISAGGDGSINYLINTLINSPNINLQNIIIGAIGLGSSNDFLKPIQDTIRKIPLRINYKGPYRIQDIGEVTFRDEKGKEQKRYFIINASFGVTANANWNFNHPGKLLSFLKLHFTDAAILFTSIQTILRFKNSSCNLEFNEEHFQAAISNINLLKSPYVSGSLHYSQHILPDDGQFGLNICLNMNKMELLNILFQLGKGKFKRSNKTISTFTKTFHITSTDRIIFEFDGETEQSNDISIRILPNTIKVLSS